MFCIPSDGDGPVVPVMQLSGYSISKSGKVAQKKTELNTVNSCVTVTDLKEGVLNV